MKKFTTLWMLIGIIFITSFTPFTARAIVISGDLLTVTGGAYNLPAGNYQVLAGTHIFVPAGVNFTFDPGVNIYFENGAFLETGTTSTLTMMDNTHFFFETDAMIRIMGSLFIYGTYANPVLFDKSYLLPAQEWKGIIFQNCNNDQVFIQYARIKNAIKTTGGTPELLSGALYIDNCHFSSFEVETSHFIKNEGDDHGGAVHISNSTSIDLFSFEQCLFLENTCRDDGGALACYNADIEILGCAFKRNEANDGGGIYLSNNQYNLVQSSVFVKNTGRTGGGAMFNRDSSPAMSVELINNSFDKNVSTDTYGGGVFSRNYLPNYTFYANDNSFRMNSGRGMYMYNQNPASYTLFYNEFIENTESGLVTNCWDGNGDFQIFYNSFIMNEAVYGAGAFISSGNNVDLLQNIFEDNIADSYGGGLCARYGFNTLNIRQNTFKRNITNNYDGGGACFIECSAVDPLLILLNVFSENETHRHGGAIASINETGLTKQILNNMIVNNIAGSGGGGVYCENDFSFQNNTIADNKAYSGGGIYAVANTSGIQNFNNILWSNSPNQANAVISAGSFSSFDYSDIQGNGYTGTNIDINPLFASMTDYHLQTTSPCINTGQPGFSSTAYSPYWKSDIDIETRIYSTIDMGADEVLSSTITLKNGEQENNKFGDNKEIQMNIYPNPVSDQLNISVPMNTANDQTIRIYDQFGKNILESIVVPGTLTTLSVNSIREGIYILQYQDKNEMIIIKH